MDDRAYLREARAHLAEEMDQGASWEEAAAVAGLLVSRATAYRIWLRAWREGPISFEDARHGHPAKVHTPFQTWLVAYCQAAPHTPSHQLQPLIQHHFAITLSVRHLNRVRAALGVGWVRPPTPKKTEHPRLRNHRLSRREPALCCCWPLPTRLVYWLP